MWTRREGYTLLGFISSHHSCPKCRCVSSGSSPAFLWGYREDLVLQWFPFGGTGGTASWAWDSNSSAWIEQHSRHPWASKAELADIRPPGGHCLSWELSGAQTGHTKMLEDFFLDFWGLGYTSEDWPASAMSGCMWPGMLGTETHLSMDCSP